MRSALPGFITISGLKPGLLAQRQLPVIRATLLGNHILSHFNVIPDNPSGRIFLKPNSRVGELYSDYESYLKIVKQ